jgi:hypothetical protein
MSKKVFRFLGIILGVFVFGTGFVQKAEAPSFDSCSFENSSFVTGEELVYKIYYNLNFVWMPAGEVTFKVSEKDGMYHMTAKGRSYSSYDWFFKVKDDFEAFVDKATMLPVQTVRDVQEGGYKVYDKVTYNQDGKVATSIRGDTKETAKPKNIKLTDCTHDMLSIMYSIRNVPFESKPIGTTVPFKLLLDQEIYPLGLKYVGKEKKVNVKGLGNFNTMKFNPQIVSGEVFNKNAVMSIWVSDDENRIPVAITSPVSVGSVKVVLKSFKGLRHPFSGKL